MGINILNTFQLTTNIQPMKVSEARWGTTIDIIIGR
jgi:hypothetical protein